MIIPHIEFETQGALVKLTMRNGLASVNRRKSGARRGRVTSFSAKSRKRLLELAARLDLAAASLGSPIIFITLTYGQEWPEFEQVSRNLRAFLERLRRFAPESSAIWRIEYQSRGAPHFHLICFKLPYLDKITLSAWWAEVIGCQYWDNSGSLPKHPFTRIEAIKSGRRAMSYLSKYVAKLPDAAAAPARFQEDAGGEGGFNYVPYLHVGRWWGVFNSEKLPFAKLVKSSLMLAESGVKRVFFDMRRLMAARWWRANKGGRYKGASVFVDSSDKWLDYWFHLWLEYCT